MFRSRVQGVGITVKTTEQLRLESEQAERNRPALEEYQRKLAAWNEGLQMAHSKCPPPDPNIRFIQAPVCQPAVDYMNSNPMPVAPGNVTAPTPTSKPTGSALPLLLGAAYLLLS
jgi:hypothetical protein